MIRTFIIVYLTLLHAGFIGMYWLYTNDTYTLARIDTQAELSDAAYTRIVGEAGSEAHKSTFAVLDKKGDR